MLGTICTWIVAFYFLGYFIPHLFVAWFYKTKNLKKAYNAKWALVTGSSSGEHCMLAASRPPLLPHATHRPPTPPSLPSAAGIGKAMAKRLASQGLNVVIVSLDDALLEETFTELSAAYPDVSFRKVGVNLGRPGYLPTVAAATADIDVQCVFLNAGYVVTGFFDSLPLERHMENMECNATSAVQITHLFLQRMVSFFLVSNLQFFASFFFSFACISTD